MTGLVLAAAIAAGDDAAALEAEAAARAGSCVPLAAWPAELEELGSVLDAAASGLLRASKLAAVILGPDPALPYPGAVPSALGVASARAAGAASDVAVARGNIVRELRRLGTGPDAAVTPLGSRAARAGQSLGELAGALQDAAREGDAGLDVLVPVTEQQALALEALGRAFGGLFRDVTATCEGMPGAAAWRTTRAAGPLRRASSALRKAAGGTTLARGHLADVATRAGGAAP